MGPGSYLWFAEYSRRSSKISAFTTVASSVACETRSISGRSRSRLRHYHPSTYPSDRATILSINSCRMYFDR
jgi:hypothetical protein